MVAITKTTSSTAAFIFSLLLLSSSPLFLFLPWCDFEANISCISSGPTRSTEPTFGRLFTQMTVKFVTFLKKRLLFVASNSGKRCWDWTLLRIRAQIELSSTSVYDYKMSTSGSSAKNSLLTQGAPMTMMPMPVNRITSQCKIKLSQKYYPWINLKLWNFCHSFLQWVGSFFLITMFCSAIHVYTCTDRFADMSITVIRPPYTS